MPLQARMKWRDKEKAPTPERRGGSEEDAEGGLSAATWNHGKMPQGGIKSLSIGPLRGIASKGETMKKSLPEGALEGRQLVLRRRRCIGINWVTFRCISMV